MKKFVCELSTDNFKQLLDSIIIHKKDNNKAKFLQFVKMDCPNELVGELKQNSFHVWTYNGWLFGTGPFFPVLDCEFRPFNERTLVTISSRMNIVGKTILAIIIVALAWAITAGVIIQEDNSFRFLICRTLAGLILFLTFMTVPFFSYRHLRARIIEWLITELKLKRYVCI